MSTPMVEIEFEKYIKPCKQMLRDGKTVEDVLKHLRNETNSKVTSMAVIMDVLDLAPSEAKSLVHKSLVWGDVRERDEKFHKDVITTIEEMNNRE